MNEEEKEDIELDIEAKYVDRTEKEFLSNITYAECLYILTPKNKYCDKIRELSVLKLCEIIDKLQKENKELKNKIMEKELEIIGKEEDTKASMREIIEQYYTANEDCIAKQRIEDIIDRIDYDIKKTKEIISNNSNIYTSDRRNNYQIVRLRAMNTKSLDIKKRLQELLESEE